MGPDSPEAYRPYASIVDLESYLLVRDTVKQILG